MPQVTELPLFLERSRGGGITGVPADAMAPLPEAARMVPEAHPSPEAFLLELTDRITDLADPQAIIAMAVEALGPCLQVDLVGYAETGACHEQIVLRQEWVSPGALPSQTPLRLEDVDGKAAELRAGRTLHSEGGLERPALLGLGAVQDITPGASVVVPLVEDGALVAVLYLRQDHERSWTGSEIALAETVAKRIRRAVERARAMIALRESETRFRTLADTLPALVWIVDPDLRLVYANARWRDFSGLPPEKALDYSWKDSVHPDDVAGVVQRVESMKGQEVAFSFEMRYRSLSGEDRWHLIQAEPIRNARGELTSWFGASVDIHDQKLAEEALRQSEERLSLAQRAARIGVFDWDAPTGRVTWTAEQERLFGLEPGTFEGTVDGWASRVVPDEVPATLGSIWDAVARGDREIDFAYDARLPDGSVRCVQGMAMIFYAADGVPLRIVGVNIDITDRREADERQHLLIRELHHRVKNTLATVQALVSSTARTATSIDDFHQGFVGRIVSLAQTHNLLTEDFWQKVSLKELLHTELDPYGDGERSRVVIDGQAVELTSDTAVPIGMAIHELTTNAAKHGALSAPSGRVEVRWLLDRSGDAPALRFAWTESGGPRVEPPQRQGFGSRLLRRVLTTQLQADVQIAFEPEGLRFHMTMPLPEATVLFNPLT